MAPGFLMFFQEQENEIGGAREIFSRKFPSPLQASPLPSKAFPFVESPLTAFPVAWKFTISARRSLSCQHIPKAFPTETSCRRGFDPPHVKIAHGAASPRYPSPSCRAWGRPHAAACPPAHGDRRPCTRRGSWSFRSPRKGAQLSAPSACRGSLRARPLNRPQPDWAPRRGRWSRAGPPCR